MSVIVASAATALLLAVVPTKGESAASGFSGLILPVKVASLFGNVRQVIGIARGVLAIFSKRALKPLDNQTEFDSAIRRFDPSRPSQLMLLD